MLSDILQSTAALIIDYAALLLMLLLLTLIGIIIYMYIVDVRQTRHAIRRNYPVIWQFRYWFEHLGEFFRQYFFTTDREELFFNRTQRSWVYQAAKNIDTTIAFGSSRPFNQGGDIIFLNALFPKLKHEFKPAEPITFGEGYVRDPYAAASVFNISAIPD